MPCYCMGVHDHSDMQIAGHPTPEVISFWDKLKSPKKKYGHELLLRI
jgi:hypothetical protein